jgi:hypothetical protein
MFDTNFIMLIAVTLLEGAYFGRSSKISDYMEKYNTAFDDHSDILARIENAIDIIGKLGLSEDSYWFNKANLFTLMIELNRVNPDKLDFQQLETRLLELEKKVDLFYNGEEEDLKALTPDEIKYFEYARHGSHEQPSREHRGKVVKEVIENSLITDHIELDLATKNMEIIQNKGIPFGHLVVTRTGLNKNIMDAVSNVRTFMKEIGYHDYASQDNGPDNKVKKNGRYIYQNNESKEMDVSMYRANGRGDCRIWFTGLADFAEADSQLLLIYHDNTLKVLNITAYDYSEYLASL